MTKARRVQNYNYKLAVFLIRAHASRYKSGADLGFIKGGGGGGGGLTQGTNPLGGGVQSTQLGGLGACPPPPEIFEK